MAMKIMMQKSPDAKAPSIAHKGDAGADLYAAGNHKIMPMEVGIIPTGVKVAIPKGYAGLIWDKSGIASRHSVHNIAGVIDSGYRGEIKVVMINMGKEAFEINKGMKIAQLIIHEVPEIEFVESDSLDETSRGDRGFGSTGLH